MDVNNPLKMVLIGIDPYIYISHSTGHPASIETSGHQQLFNGTQTAAKCSTFTSDSQMGMGDELNEWWFFMVI